MTTSATNKCGSQFDGISVMLSYSRAG